MRCHSQRCSAPSGKCTTMRRTEVSIQAPSLINRSRSVLTCALAGGSLGGQSHFLHQHVRRRRDQHAQLIGQKVRATGAVDLQSVVQLFYAILDVTATTVDTLVQMPWSLLEVRHDKASIVLRQLAFRAYHLCLDQHASLAFLPTLGGIAGLTEDVRRLVSDPRQPSGAAHQSSGTTFQYLVFSHSDQVTDVAVVQEIQQLGAGKSAIEPAAGRCIRRWRVEVGRS